MDAVSNNQHFTNEHDSFIFTLDAVAAFLSGNIQRPSMTLSEVLVLCFTSGVSKKEEQIDELLEKADDLLLEKLQRLQSTLEQLIRMWLH